MKALGIDVGGSGIKGALVDGEIGDFCTDRIRIPTPQPATPESIAGVIKDIAEHFSWQGPIGCGFPSAIQQGVVRTAANIDKSWIGTNAEELFSKATGCSVRVINDADAAGMAEIRYGAGRGKKGVVMMITLGTGIGTALFSDGILLPNTELGHLVIDGVEAEHYAAASVRKNQALGWEEWGLRLNKVLNIYDALFWPDVFILGGGVSKKHEKFFHHLDTNAEIVPAQMRNKAGIIGAAAGVL